MLSLDPSVAFPLSKFHPEDAPPGAAPVEGDTREFFLFLAQEQAVEGGAHALPGGGYFAPRRQRSGLCIRPAAEAMAGRPARCSAFAAAFSRRRSLPVLDRFQRSVRAAASAGVQERMRRTGTSTVKKGSLSRIFMGRAATLRRPDRCPMPEA